MYDKDSVYITNNLLYIINYLQCTKSLDIQLQVIITYKFPLESSTFYLVSFIISIVFTNHISECQIFAYI